MIVRISPASQLVKYQWVSIWSTLVSTFSIKALDTSQRSGGDSLTTMMTEPYVVYVKRLETLKGAWIRVYQVRFEQSITRVYACTFFLSKYKIPCSMLPVWYVNSAYLCAFWAFHSCELTVIMRSVTRDYDTWNDAQTADLGVSRGKRLQTSHQSVSELSHLSSRWAIVLLIQLAVSLVEPDHLKESW